MLCNHHKVDAEHLLTTSQKWLVRINCVGLHRMWGHAFINTNSGGRTNVTQHIVDIINITISPLSLSSSSLPMKFMGSGSPWKIQWVWFWSIPVINKCRSISQMGMKILLWHLRHWHFTLLFLWAWAHCEELPNHIAIFPWPIPIGLVHPSFVHLKKVYFRTTFYFYRHPIKRNMDWFNKK